MDALEIQNICVRNGALDLEVGMAIDTLHVTEEQANRILELLPNLANHVCVNGAGDGSFGNEIVGICLSTSSSSCRARQLRRTASLPGTRHGSRSSR